MIKGISDINPYAVNNFIQESPENINIVRAEYSRLRATAQQRLNRLSGSDFSGIAKNYKGSFPTLKNIKSSRELGVKLSEVNSFLNSPRSTIKGNKAIRKQIIAALQDRGFDYVNEENFEDFTEFMDAVKQQNLDKLYGSAQIIDEVFQKISEDKKRNVEQAIQDFTKKRKGAISKAKEKRRKAEAQRQRKEAAKKRSTTEAARNAKRKQTKGKNKKKRR